MIQSRSSLSQVRLGLVNWGNQTPVLFIWLRTRWVVGSCLRVVASDKASSARAIACSLRSDNPWLGAGVKLSGGGGPVVTRSLQKRQVLLIKFVYVGSDDSFFFAKLI